MRSIVQVYGPNLRIFRSFDLFGVKDLCNNLRTLSIIIQTVFVNYYFPQHRLKFLSPLQYFGRIIQTTKTKCRCAKNLFKDQALSRFV